MWGFGSFHVHRRGSPRAQNEDAPFGCFLMVAVPVAFAISTYFAWEELWYAIRGRTALAKVHVVSDSRERSVHRRGRPVYHVGYSFIESATPRDLASQNPRAESDDIPVSWDRPEGTIEIQYIYGWPGWSRVRGNHSYLSLVFFVACVMVAVVYGTALFREARQAVRESEWHEAMQRDDS